MVPRKSFLFVLATAALALAPLRAARAGGDEVVPETRTTERIYDAPTVYYPAPVVRIGFYPAFGFYGRPYGYYGHHRYYGGRHYYGRGGHWRGHHRW